jgi:hypothetical protein
MEPTNKIEIIVKIPLDMATERLDYMMQCVATEILKDRDWSLPHERKMTFRDKTSDSQNLVELHLTLTPDIKKDNLAALVARFAYFVK